MTTKARAVSATVKADNSFEVVDARGRKLVYRPLDIIEQYDLPRAMGNEASQNQTMFLMASFAAGVRAIDGKPRPFPTNDAEVRAALRDVDNEGISALQDEILARISKQETLAEVEAEVKNS